MRKCTIDCQIVFKNSLIQKDLEWINLQKRPLIAYIKKSLVTVISVTHYLRLDIKEKTARGVATIWWMMTCAKHFFLVFPWLLFCFFSHFEGFQLLPFYSIFVPTFFPNSPKLPNFFFGKSGKTIFGFNESKNSRRGAGEENINRGGIETETEVWMAPSPLSLHLQYKQLWVH